MFSLMQDDKGWDSAVDRAIGVLEKHMGKDPEIVDSAKEVTRGTSPPVLEHACVNEKESALPDDVNVWIR